MSEKASPDDSMQTAVLLIAHGSRRESANDELAQLAEQVARAADYCVVEAAYLEIAHPTIPEGAKRCVSAGARRVLMCPYFLSYGAHVVDDLQRILAQLSQQYPAVDFRLCEPIGRHPSVTQIVLDHLHQAERLAGPPN